VAGKITEDLMMNGKDEFLQTASEHQLLYTDYNIAFGAPMWSRVGRHLSGTLAMIAQMNLFESERELLLSFPNYKDMETYGIGHFLHDPTTADSAKVFMN
jgi:hypothetical protein